MKAIISAAVAILMLAACTPAATPTHGTEPSATVGAVTLIETPNLSEGVEALPRLAGDSPAIARINAELDRSDADAVESAKACAGNADGYSRWIERPMTGPAYLTLGENDAMSCGGAYPSTHRIAITYDVATGERVDWAAAIPGLGLTFPATEGEGPGDRETLRMRSAALGAWYGRKMLANPDSEWMDQCRDVFDPAVLAEQTFNLWADAENGGVTVKPDFAHVVQTCAESLTLTAVDLRAFNADPNLVAAITAAHAAGNWAPKEEAEPAA